MMARSRARPAAVPSPARRRRPLAGFRTCRRCRRSPPRRLRPSRRPRSARARAGSRNRRPGCRARTARRPPGWPEPSGPPRAPPAGRGRTSPHAVHYAGAQQAFGRVSLPAPSSRARRFAPWWGANTCVCHGSS